MAIGRVSLALRQRLSSGVSKSDGRVSWTVSVGTGGPQQTSRPALSNTKIRQAIRTRRPPHAPIVEAGAAAGKPE
jgi:hypothetical protein